MFESLLSAGGIVHQDTGDVIFLYDPDTNQDLSGNGAVSVLSGGAVRSDTQLVDGLPSLSLPTVAAKQLITFPTPLNLRDTNWTLEWSSFCSTVPSAYANDLILDSNGPTTGALYTRYGDSGFGNRFVVSDLRGSANPALTRPIAYTKAALQNQLVHWALVQAEGNIFVYKDGIRQMLAGGASSTTYNIQSTTAINIESVYQIRAGDANGSSVRASPGYKGRIRLSNYARYRSNYTPQPLTM
ncbi:hypothetical protein [Pseudomonas phage D6]|nr:hypothetical protein [Pseudomonas phage D6]